MASQKGIIQKGLNEKEIMLMLFKEETRVSAEECLEGSQEEVNVFNAIFLQNGPSHFEKFRIRGQNIVLCRIVDSSGQGILSSYNIGCILPSKKQVLLDKTGTGTGTGTELVPVPVHVPPLTPPSFKKELRIVNQNAQRDTSGFNIDVGGTKFVSQDIRTAIPVPVTPVPSSSRHMELKVVYQRNEYGTMLALGDTRIVSEAPVKAPLVLAHVQAPVPAPLVPLPVKAPLMPAHVKSPPVPTPVKAPVPAPVPVKDPLVPTHVQAPVPAPLVPLPVKAPLIPAHVKSHSLLVPTPVKAPVPAPSVTTPVKAPSVPIHVKTSAAPPVPALPIKAPVPVLPVKTSVPLPVKELVPVVDISKMTDPSLTILRTHLRAHANRLLEDCGYRLLLRKRKDKNCNNSWYCSPQNGPILQNLPKPWISLGNRLMLQSSPDASGSNNRDVPGKQWVNINEFTSELRSTLIRVESMIKDNNNSQMGLLDRWLLLDPFVAVSFIDRKIGELKKGIPLRVVRRKTSVLSEEERKNVDTSLSHRHSKCKKSLLPILMSQSKSEAKLEGPVKLFDDVPIGSTFSINNVSQSISPHKPVLNLILYPPNIPLPFDSHGQNTTTVSVPGNEFPVFEASFFQGNLAFDGLGGFTAKESLINWAVCDPVKSKSNKKKRKSSSDTKEMNNLCKRFKNIVDIKDPVKNVERENNKGVCCFNDEDLLISAIIMRKTKPLKYSKYPKKQRNSQMGKKQAKNKRFSKGARTILKLLIDTGVISHKRKIRYKKSKVVVKQGKLTRKGVLCQCCGEKFSILGFRLHADFCSKPGLNLFLGSGKPLVISLFEAWCVEYKERRERIKVREIERNDDACGVCADVGKLVCCDTCPVSFHQSCLPNFQNVQEECWSCPRCICDICGDLVSKSMKISSPNGFLECFQCGNKYHANCKKDKIILNEDTPRNTWFCENECHQVYMHMRSKVGASNYIGHGFYFTTLRCNHGEEKKTLNSEEIAILAENNMKLVIALRLTEECFSPMLDPRTGLDLIPLILYNWRVDMANIDYKGFYTLVLEKDERIISVASIRLHGAKVAEIPLIATCMENRGQGMCRFFISAIEKMLKSLNVKMILVSAISDLLEMWTSHLGFVPIEDTDKGMLCKLNLISLEGTVFLKKNLV